MIATALGIALVLPAWAAVLIVACIHFVLGGAAFLIGMARAHRPELGIEPEEEQQVQLRAASPMTGLPQPRQDAGPLVYPLGG